MKKVFLSIAFAAAVMTANAQDLMSKNGTPILPQAGDWSIGFDVVQTLGDFANVFKSGGNTNNTLNQYQGVPTLTGLYVVNPTTAYRGVLKIGFGSTSVTQAGGPGFDSLSTPSKASVSEMNITLGFGIQKSRGKGRLHGIYGVQIAVNFGGVYDTTFTYFKPLAATAAGTQVTEDKNGSTFGVGLSGFLGAEYFFAPKMSLSAEYGWGLGIGSTGAGALTATTSDGLNTATSITTTTYNTSKSSNFNLDVISAAQIVMHLYF